jgi:hypothetical protein
MLQRLAVLHPTPVIAELPGTGVLGEFAVEGRKVRVWL